MAATASSKAFKHHWAALACWFAFYNFAAFTSRSGSRPQWPLRSPITFGTCGNRRKSC